MCIFCGGTCGGVGDAILPSAVLGISLAVVKIQEVRASRQRKRQEKSDGEQEAKPGAPAS